MRRLRGAILLAAYCSVLPGNNHQALLWDGHGRLWKAGLELRYRGQGSAATACKLPRVGCLHGGWRAVGAGKEPLFGQEGSVLRTDSSGRTPRMVCVS